MIRSIATVMRGTALVQALGLAVLPLLTRLYNPVEFGHYQLYQSASILIVVIVSLRYEVALLRAQSGRELNATMALCMFVTVVMSIVLALGWAATVEIWPELYMRFPASPMFVGLTVFLIGIFQLFSYLVARDKLFSTSANSKVAQAIGYAGVASALGTIGVSVGLIVADAISRLGASMYLIVTMRDKYSLRSFFVEISEIKAAAWKYREFPFVSVFGGVVNSLGAIVTPVMIYAKFNSEIAGQFALVERSLALPIAMLVSAISQVYTSFIADQIRNNSINIEVLFHKTIKTLAFYSAIPAIIAFYLAPNLFVYIFGDQWLLAGEIAQIMIPAYFVIFVYGGVNMTVMLLGRQVLQMSWEIIRLALMLVLWAVIVDPEMSLKAVITLHALVLGAMSILFIGIAEYSVRRGPTKAALNHAL